MDDEVSKLLFNDMADESAQSEEKDKKEFREATLKIVDISLIGADEYEIFLNFGIANIITIMQKEIHTKLPESSVIKSLVQEAMSHAVSTYDMQKAMSAKGTFATHFVWQLRAAVTTYNRHIKRDLSNEMSHVDDEMADHLQSNLLHANLEGEQISNSSEDTPTHLLEDEQKLFAIDKKLELGMRHVRYELPSENNLLLDVYLGEITRSDGTKFTLTEWSELTGKKYSDVLKIIKGTKSLIVQKLRRKHYLDFIFDSDKSVEDLTIETDLSDAMKAQVESENILTDNKLKQEVDMLQHGVHGIDDALKILLNEKDK